MVEIRKVEPGSTAARAGLEKGDNIISINGKPVRDFIDFQYETSDSFFTLEIENKKGQIQELDIERKPGQVFGLTLDGIIYDRLKLCQNNCIFCFVRQQPPGMRKTLLLKDDDYRFSFLQGSFITLSNLSKEEFCRIINLKLSPLNISVHTTNPELRVKMMHNPRAGNIMKQLKRLASGGIKFNTQIVLCPGYNDGYELERTLEDLSNLYPDLLSIGIVPVGLTRYRDNLLPLTGYDNNSAVEVINQIKRWQDKLKEKKGVNFLYCADELYFLAGEELPLYDDYNGFPQIENGIGLTRLLWQELEEIQGDLPAAVSPGKVGIITGKAGEKALKPVQKELSRIKGLDIELIVVNNNFFGESVTVTGLLTGKDMMMELKSHDNLPENIIIPAVTVNENGFFLDGMKPSDLEEYFSEYSFYICNNIEEIVEVILDDKTCCGNCR